MPNASFEILGFEMRVKGKPGPDAKLFSFDSPPDGVIGAFDRDFCVCLCPLGNRFYDLPPLFILEDCVKNC